jgi:hypothetical protein
VDAHRAAHHYQQIEGAGRRQALSVIEPNGPKGMPAIGCPRRNVARAFKGDVLQADDTHLSPENKPLTALAAAYRSGHRIRSPDANQDGKIEKKELPSRMQGIFERGDSNHDQILSHEELVAMSEANHQVKLPARHPGGAAFNAAADTGLRILKFALDNRRFLKYS